MAGKITNKLPIKATKKRMRVLRMQEDLYWMMQMEDKAATDVMYCDRSYNL